ncbi:MAG: Ig-like domain-containing protein, partial [Steroidobacter sp.]
ALLRVKPGDADNSYLVQKIDGRATIGGRMPLGRNPLPQASIDLVRSWIAAGATMNSAVDDGRFSIQSTIPAAGEVSVAAVKEFQIIFNSEIDASLVQSAAISIEASGGDGSFSEGNEVILPLADVRVSPANARVLVVYPAASLAGDDYRLVIDTADGISLADNAARTLDGDGDGKAGGAFTLTFHGAAK